ncbi:adenosylcobinamide amidohydrolase [Halorussus aquaticus]|uniref:Adenosylcobinamide amidohydrolase n=1 Tax=Halorussus aquaticus TaxID=2953748 RepID=A0ABD5Q127_9EURY|nr:adenosylcobinamide amidohydrolase [Halorussus aquaticus]
MFETETREGVLRVGREGARWLSTGWDGGEWRADAAYNVSVPEGFDRTDLDAYLAERRRSAGFDDPGPALLTGVALRHARGARCGPVSAVATAGVSNPAALPMDPDGEPAEGDGGPSDSDSDASDSDFDSGPEIGTVNVVVGTDRALAPGALPNLLAVAVEAKTATLLAETGFPGTTSDAVVAACDPAGEETTFSGSATEVGACARVCVREAVRAGLESRYGDATDATIPESVADADYGATATRRATVFTP